MEIERKFLIKRLPGGLDSYPAKRITQGYISRCPAIRVRDTDGKYRLTVKGRGRLAHEEFELDISREAYERLLKKVDGIIISKTRYLIPCPPYTVELDVFAGELFPLVVAEVEFPSVEEAEAFSPPDWFGREVTYDKSYSNANMTVNGRPELN